MDEGCSHLFSSPEVHHIIGHQPTRGDGSGTDFSQAESIVWTKEPKKGKTAMDYGVATLQPRWQRTDDGEGS
jgi:hypothetical protein